MKPKFLIRSIAAACVLAAAGAASADPTYPDFTVTTGGLGGTAGLPTVVANDISGQYHEVITFTSATTFTLTLDFYAQGFNYDDNNAALSTSYSAAQSGLGSSYELLAIFNDTGTYSTTSGVVNFAIDKNAGNLTLSYDAGAHAQFTAPSNPKDWPNPDSQYQINSNGDTITTLATGMGLTGNGSENCTAPNLCGAFGQMTSFNLTPAGSQFFTSPVPFYSLNLQSGQFEGFPVAVGTSVTTTGTINAVFQAVPEPASLGIVGIALAGLGFAKRRKKGAPALDNLASMA